MRIKVFATIFISFILVIVTNSVGRFVSEKIKYSASEAIVDRVLGEDKYSVSSKIELLDLASSEEYQRKFSTANREVAQEYRFYLAVSLLIQGLMFFGIAIGAAYIVIRVVSRNGQP